MHLFCQCAAYPSNNRGLELKIENPDIYTAPTFTCHALRVIALGGTPGFGDSSPQNTNPPIDSFGGSTENWEEDFDEDPPGY
jgi:hypothetical protein